MATGETNNQGNDRPIQRSPGRPRKIEGASAPADQPRAESDNLSDRQRDILRIVIQEFVTTAAPVSSESLVSKYRLTYSSATVRNEMADLERQGYITHPHTSAGRVPSDKGYRYFVEHLMVRPSSLSALEQHTIQHQFYQIQLEMNEWLRLAASVTARMGQNAALVSAPHIYDSRLKYVQLIGVQESAALLIVVSQDGTIKEQMLTLDQPQSQDDLTKISNRLNSSLAHLNWKQMENRLKEWTEEPGKHIASRMIELLKSLDQKQEAQLYRDGLVNILNQPEFSDIGRVRQVVQVLENGQPINNLIPEVLASDGNAVQVIIGGDNRFDDLRLLSVVLARYGIDGQVAGVVGIVGPTRMEYSRSISTVQYVSQLLSGLMSERRG